VNLAFIDVTSTLFYGGVQTAIWQLAIALTDLGHQVTVYGGDGAICPDLGGRDVRINRFSYTSREKFPNLGTRFRKFAERWTFSRHARTTVVEADHDWVILTKPFDFFWPRLMPAGKRTRFAFMSGGTDFMPGDRRLARGIDAWVACSHFNAWQIGDRYSVYPNAIFNGVDITRFSPDCRDPELRTALGVQDEDVLFAFAGRLVGWKGMQVAIAALAEPELRDFPARLMIIGGGAARESWQALARELHVGDRVRFVPPQAHGELPRYYASADAGIFPSLGDEAFGITIAEAMACGLPVVASYNGGIPEVVGNEGSAGLLFEIGNVSQCARAMAALCASPARRQFMGLRARQRIVDQFTWQAAAARLLAALAAAEHRS